MDGTSEVVRIRGALDAALLDLRAVKDPGVPLADAEGPLARSVALVYQALASTHDATAFRRALAEAAREAAEALAPLRRSGSSDPAVVRSTTRLADAVRTLGRPLVIPLGLEIQLPGRTAGAGLAPALLDEPRLLELQRPVLEPAVPLAAPEGMPPLEEVDPEAPPPGGPFSIEALLAEATAAGLEEPAPPPPPTPTITAPAPDPASTDRMLFGEALTEDQLRFDRARHFFEDLGMMSVMRRAVDGAHWRTPASVERRLLARLDAIVACGVPVFPGLVRLLARSPIPDAELTWAAIVLHGMIAGDDMFDEVLRLVRVTDLADEACFDAVADALRFLPHPRTVPTLQAWLTQEPVLRRLALRALGASGVLPVSEAIRALREAAPEIRREGARALPLATGPLDPAVLLELLRHPDPEVVEPALHAGLLRGQRAAAAIALRLLQEGRGEFARAALYAAISSSEESRPVFARAWSGPMGPALMDALGWLGDLAAVEPLLARLEAKDAAAVGPLQRLLGASLSDADPEPEEPRDAPSFGEAWRPPRPFEILTAKPGPWRAWWKAHAPRPPWRARVRWGRQFSLPALLWEIDLATLGPDARRLTHLELCLRTRLSLPLATDDFVVRQERQVTAWQQALAQRPGEAVGRWSLRLSDG